MTRRAVYPGKAVSAVLTGADELSGWDEEELIRGQRRNKRGKFTGSKPKIVPKALHDELVKRKMTKAYDLLNESIYDAVAILIDIAKDTRTEDGVRLKAVKEILDRTIGKTPINVQIEPSRMSEAFQAMLIPEEPSALPQRSTHDILDAEVVDDD
jgi:hypothetical protein